ncbi:MAG: hypothetical protein ACYCXN_04725 [Acidimicrobiales bacterium]
MRTRYGVVSNRPGSGVLAGVVPREDDNGRHPEVVSRLAAIEGAGETGALGALARPGRPRRTKGQDAP